MNLQKAAKMIGESGCYFLSILKASGNEWRALAWYRDALEARPPWIRDDCLVLKPGALLSACMEAGYGGRQEVDKAEGWEAADYQAQPGEIEFLRYEIVKELGPGKQETFSHFVLGDGQGGIAWDPWEGSNTVRNGKLVSKRIFRKKG